MDSEKWNDYWSRPYTRYEGHQQWFWDNVYPLLQGPILDIGVGSASMWKGTNYDVTGFDYSEAGINEAKKNYPNGKFFVSSIEEFSPHNTFPTVLSCGVVHYFYPDNLEVIRKAHVNASSKQIVITLNTPVDLNKFKSWGKLESAQFKDRVGWILQFSKS